MKKPSLDEHLLNNIYFDTCVYHQPGIDLLTNVIPVKNILFASEMIGAVRGGTRTPATTSMTPSAISMAPRHSAPMTARDLRRQRTPRLPAARRATESKGQSNDEYPLNQLGIVKRNIVRADRAAADRLAQYGSATVHEAMGRVGLLKPHMANLCRGAGVGHGGDGAAASGDNWMMHVVAEQIQPRHRGRRDHGRVHRRLLR